jgi:hypothetical protein
MVLALHLLSCYQESQAAQSWCEACAECLHRLTVSLVG